VLLVPICIACGSDCDCCYSLLHPQVSVVPVNCIAFDQLGTRMFAGDASGILTEVAVDLTPVTALTAAAAAAPSWSQEVACIDAGAAGSSSPVSSACGGTSAAGRCAQAAGSCEASAVASSSSSSGSHSGAGGAALVASVLRNGSVATQQLAGKAPSHCLSDHKSAAEQQ
jgi:hypothetical protein